MSIFRRTNILFRIFVDCAVTSIFVLLMFASVVYTFMECHDDPTYEPGPGLMTVLQFTWLGSLQYIHIKNGTPHYFRVPRVVLITRQFVVATAADAAQIPLGYALGNVIFGDYERDEEECKISEDQLAKGELCEPALLLVPIADVLLHPEYKHFHVKHSIALLKLIIKVQSKYMLPVCLPHRDYIRLKAEGKSRPGRFYHVDFTSEVPRDISEENKEVIYLKMLTKEKCSLYDDQEIENMSTNIKESCSSGCGLRSGAPTIIHEHTGHWSIIALAQGGSPCPDPLRQQRFVAAPSHTLIYPYVSWISTAIAGRSLEEMTKFDPFGFVMPRSNTVLESRKKGWIGKWWMGGIRCYDRGEAAENLFRFYHEVFVVQPIVESSITYYIQIDSPSTVSIVCVKVGVMLRLATPTVWDLDTTSVKVRIRLSKFHMRYVFEVEAWGCNNTVLSKEDSSDEEVQGTTSKALT